MVVFNYVGAARELHDGLTSNFLVVDFVHAQATGARDMEAGKGMPSSIS
jgi:hypothetical protein